jgi:hypothetical protein
MNARVMTVIVIGLVSASAAFGDAPQSRPIPGYQCMSLNLTEAQMSDPSVVVEIKSQPSPSAPNIGTAGSIVIVSKPENVVNGYARVLHLNGKVGWLPVGDLRVWQSADGVRRTCTPSTLANGRIGFAVR